MTGRVRVLVFARAAERDPGGVASAYHRISRALAGTPGLLGNQLMRSVSDPAEFIVMSEWESAEAFSAWESGPGHRAATAPLRPLHDRRHGAPFGVYVIEAAY